MTDFDKTLYRALAFWALTFWLTFGLLYWIDPLGWLFNQPVGQLI